MILAKLVQSFSTYDYYCLANCTNLVVVVVCFVSQQSGATATV